MCSGYLKRISCSPAISPNPCLYFTFQIRQDTWPKERLDLFLSKKADASSTWALEEEDLDERDSGEGKDHAPIDSGGIQG